MTKGQFDEDHLPPLLGKDDLNLYAEDLRDTHKEVLHDLEWSVGQRMLCITQQRRYKKEQQKINPNWSVIEECMCNSVIFLKYYCSLHSPIAAIDPPFLLVLATSFIVYLCFVIVLAG